MLLLLVHWADLSKNLEIINFLSILWDCLSTDFTDLCPAPFPPPATSWCSSVDLFTENDLFHKCQNISSPIRRCCWRTFCRFKDSVNIYEWMCGFPFFLINAFKANILPLNPALSLSLNFDIVFWIVLVRHGVECPSIWVFSDTKCFKSWLHLSIF